MFLEATSLDDRILITVVALPSVDIEKNVLDEVDVARVTQFDLILVELSSLWVKLVEAESDTVVRNVTSLDEIELITVVALPSVDIKENVLDEVDGAAVIEVDLLSVRLFSTWDNPVKSKSVTLFPVVTSHEKI